MRMGWESKANKAYEERIINDALTRLAGRLDLKGLPLSQEELRTLARRSRESFYGSERRRARLAAYKVHLAKTHGADLVERISAVLVDINNEIGYEEK